VDVILEMLANVNLGKDLTALALRGRVAIIGNRGRIEIDPRDLMSRRAEAIGVLLGLATPDELSSIHAALYAGLENETLRPVVGNEWPLAEASQAHRAVMVEAHGKNVLVP
jgi:NADPH2:quinone reductase